MLAGISTTETYEEFLTKGLCQMHLKDLDEGYPVETNELQRKALLYIRLRLLEPLLHNKPCICRKLEAAIFDRGYISEWYKGKDAIYSFEDTVMIFDAIAVFTVCYFAKMCCIGALFCTGFRAIASDDTEEHCIQNLEKTLEEKNLEHPTPLLEENFKHYNMGFVKVCYVAALVFVKDFLRNKQLKFVLQKVEKDLQSLKQFEQYKIAGDKAYKEERYDCAITDYTSALKYSPYHYILHSNRAQAYMKCEMFREAALDSYISVMINPSWCKGYWKLSSSLFHLKMYGKSYQVAEYALKKCKDAPPEVYEALESIKTESDFKHAEMQSECFIMGLKDCTGKNRIDENMDIPELIDASDSEESDIEEDLDQHRVAILEAILKEGSEALIEDCGYKAVNLYKDALSAIRIAPEIYKYSECDMVCIKFAYGMACCKSAGYEDLQKCIGLFKEIIDDHNTIKFPAAYYGLGLAYRKLNRFKDALDYLKIVNDILSKGILFKVYSWPGMTVAINETKYEYLKDLTSNLLQECRNPPLPDATCRYVSCSLKPAIYYTDPDFKGFTSLICSEHCHLQYHMQCWKTLKADMSLTDKEFLEQACLTPDCEGIFIKAQTIGKDGMVHKVFVSSETKKTSKQRKLKFEKKIDMKEIKRRNRRDSRSDSFSDLGEYCTHENSSQPISKLETLKCSGEDTGQPKFATNEITLPCDLSHNVIEKQEYCKLTANALASEKIPHSFQNTEIVEQQQNQELQEEQIDSKFEQNNIMPKIVHSPEVQDHNSDYSVCASTEKLGRISDCIRKNIYSFMEDFLNFHGPMRIDDPALMEELKVFPPEASVMIADSGGLGEFLKQNMKFGVVANTYICVVSDICSAYNMHCHSSLQLNTDDAEKLESLKINHLETEKNSKSHLNPNAVEYKPSTNICINGNEQSNDENMSGQNKVKQNNNSELLISMVSSLRQPLTTDDNIVGDNNFGKISTALICQESSSDISNESCRLSPDSVVVSHCENVDTPSAKVINGIDVNKWLDMVRTYFSDEMIPYRSLLESLLKPYSIVQTPKKINRAVQMDTPEMVSKEIMKFDSELERMKELTAVLLEEKSKLLEQKKQLEQQFDSAMDSATKYQRKSSMEIANLKKELEDANVELEAQKTDARLKEAKWESEQKRLLESLKNAKVEISEQKQEINNCMSGAESLKINIKKLDTTVSLLQNENETLRYSIELQGKEYQDIVEDLEKEKIELRNRSKCIELEMLCLKKNEVLKKFDQKNSEAVQKRQELQEGMSLVTFDHGFAKRMEILKSQISSYIRKLAVMRLEFLDCINAQIQQVENGSSLNELPPLEIKDLPDVPSWDAGLQTSTSSAVVKPLSESQASLEHQICSAFKTARPVQLSSPLKPVSVPKATDPAFKQNSKPQLTNLKFNMASDKNQNFTNEIMCSNNFNSVETHLKEYIDKHSPSGSKIVSPNISSSSVNDVNVHVCGSKQHSFTEVTKSSFSSSKDLVSSDGESADQFKDQSKMCSDTTLELGYGLKNETSSIAPTTCSSFQKPPESKSNYEKLLQKLRIKHPNYSQSELISFVKEFRQQRKGKLSGLALDTIIIEVGAIIEAKEASSKKVPNAGIRNRTFQNKTLVNKKLVPGVKPKEIIEESKEPVRKLFPWNITETECTKKWSADSDDSCVICYEDMTVETAYKVDCGHIFHQWCIREWLGKKSDCPVCRVHLLLPEDYPSLS